MKAVIFDFHDTLVQSTKAWLKAFKILSKDKVKYKKILSEYKQKTNRKKICETFNIDYSTLVEVYRCKLKLFNKGFKLYKYCEKFDFKILLMSNASRERLIKDLNKFPILKFDRVLSKEDGIKPTKKYINKVMQANNLSDIILIGNDNSEDVILADGRMSSILISEKIIKIKKIIKLFNR